MNGSIPLLDLKVQYRSIKEDVDRAVLDVFGQGNFVLGPNVKALEQEVADYIGVKHAVGVASGTDAILLSLRAIGVGPGDEIIAPAFTFFATIGPAMLLGATPVLVDVDAATYCLDVAAVEKAITPRTKAILPVHLFGHPADMAAVLQVAEAHNLRVIEDNAQAIGATYRGRITGGIGDVGCLSFYPTKNLGAYGDGGMVVTDDDEMAQQIRMLRTHGWTEKYKPEMVGYNSRLDEVQAAILRVKLGKVDEWNDARRAKAAYYTDRLSDSTIGTPRELERAKHVYHLYVVEVDARDAIAKALKAEGIDTAVYYPYPVHNVPAMSGDGYELGAFPVAEEASRRCLAIPLYPELTEDQMDRVVAALVGAT